MRKILIVCLAIYICLTLFFIYKYFRATNEGFANIVDEKETPNALTTLMSNVKRINGYLMDPALWSERIEMFSLSPVELARRELKKQLKEKNEISNEQTE